MKADDNGIAQKKSPENPRSPSPGTTQQAYVDFGSVEFNIWNSPTPPPSNTGEQVNLNKALPLVLVSLERTPFPHTDATKKHTTDEYFSATSNHPQSKLRSKLSPLPTIP